MSVNTCSEETSEARDIEVMRLCTHLSSGGNAGKPRHWEMAMRASYGLADEDRRAVADTYSALQADRRFAAMFRGAA
jgi:hypothetical protein